MASPLKLRKNFNVEMVDKLLRNLGLNFNFLYVVVIPVVKIFCLQYGGINSKFTVGTDFSELIIPSERGMHCVPYLVGNFQFIDFKYYVTQNV